MLFTKMDQEAEMDIKVKIIIKCIERYLPFGVFFLRFSLTSQWKKLLKKKLNPTD